MHKSRKFLYSNNNKKVRYMMRRYRGIHRVSVVYHRLTLDVGNTYELSKDIEYSTPEKKKVTVLDCLKSRQFLLLYAMTCMSICIFLSF
jgi:hypothetical protein